MMGKIVNQDGVCFVGNAPEATICIDLFIWRESLAQRLY
jgi:hypothetical protein